MKVRDLTAQERANLFLVGMLVCWVCSVLYAIVVLGVR
jgi:hypothetical protein